MHEQFWKALRVVAMSKLCNECWDAKRDGDVDKVMRRCPYKASL